MRAPKAPTLFENVWQTDFRMVIALVCGGFFAILNGFLRAPLDTGQALFALVKP